MKVKIEKYYVSEIYALLSQAKTDDERITIMRSQSNNKDFITTLTNIAHPKVVFHFDTIPDYRILNGQPDFGMISYNEALSKDYLFIIGHPKASPNIKPRQRENLLLQILESLSGEESKVYANMILKKTGIEGVGVELIRQAFPNLVPYEIKLEATS